MQGQQVLNLEQSSFILWHPKETESMGVHRVVSLGCTHTQEKDAKAMRVQRARASGLLLGCGATEVHEKRCPTSAGAGPAVPLEAKAFEAPHEKCQNTQ